MRIKFKLGKQKEFFNKVLEKTNCPSIRELRKRGLDVSYSALKNYYCERRLVSEELFDILCTFAGINKDSLDYDIVEDNWGQVKGGKKSRRN